MLQRVPVSKLIWSRIPNSAQLAALAFLFSIIIGVPLGVLAAVTRGGRVGLSCQVICDHRACRATHSGSAWWLIFVFAVSLEWLPTSRKSGFDSMILPAITLGWGSAGGQLRLVRSSMLEVLDSEFIKLARAKGVPGMSVVWKHALRNAMIAPLTFAGLTLGGPDNRDHRGGDDIRLARPWTAVDSRR